MILSVMKVLEYILQGILEELITVEYELTADGDTITHSFAYETSSSDCENQFWQ